MPIVDHNRVPEVPWRPGCRKWYLAGSEQGVTSTLSMDSIEPGNGAPVHTHTIDEFIVILDGSLEVMVDGASYVVGKNHTLVIPPGTEHGFKAAGSDAAQLLVFFPTLDPYSEKYTHYLEGSRPPSAGN